MTDLTKEERAAIGAYAAANGRCWKAKLIEDWAAARTTGELQALRNSRGPEWLAKFSLTTLSAAERRQISSIRRR